MTTFSHTETRIKLLAILGAVSGLPATQIFENTKPASTIPAIGVPYLTESYVPATSTLETTTRGRGMWTGLYVVTIYGVAGTGNGPILTIVDAMLAVFCVGASFVMASGNVLRVSGRPGPSPGQIIPLDTGFAACQLTIPWWVDAPI